MLEQVSNAWKNNRTMFLLVAIPVGLLLISALFLKGYREYILASAKKLLEKATSKDKQLSEEANKADAEANQHKAKADEIAKEVKKVDGDNDADWNKKV